MDEELNLEDITVEDAKLMYYHYGRRLVLNDGRVVGIEEKEDKP